MRQDGWLAQGREQHCSAEAGPLGNRSQIGESREGFQTRLGNHAIAHPEIQPGLITQASRRPARLDGWATGGLEDHGTVGQQNA
jgi:hypothetical protein